MFQLHKISEKQYDALIAYAFVRCDAISFRMPHPNNRSGEKDAEGNLAHLDDTEYSNYLKKNEELINSIETSLLDVKISKKYIYSTYGNYSTVYLMQFTENVKEELLKRANFTDWKFPDLPEDICFFSKGKCWMYTIATEKLYFLYSTDAADKAFLKKNHIHYDEFEEEEYNKDFYSLEYSLKY